MARTPRADPEGTRRRPGPRRPWGLPSGPDEVTRAVLDAAARLFARDGVSAVTMRDIAKEARVNLALIGRYIGSRDELVRAVLADLSDQVVAQIRSDPTGEHGFDPDSVAGRWTRVLTHLVISDPGTAIEFGSGPVKEMREVAAAIYGVPEEVSRLRIAQVFASALGWRIFEDFLVSAAGLDAGSLEDLRSELNHTHRRLAATPLPSPPDPEVRRDPDRG